MGNYITVADIRAEGISESIPEARIDRRIAKWEAIVEKVTGNVFRVISPGELTFPGSGTPTLFFNTPLVAVSQVRINGESVALPSTEWRAYTGKSKPRDDRYNPRLELIKDSGANIFTGARGIFEEGVDQYITATWGFVDENNSTPGPIVDALLELVIRDLQPYQDKVDDGGRPLTHVVQRRVDQSYIRYDEARELRILSALVPRDIYDTLMLYRAPWIMA